MDIKKTNIVQILTLGIFVSGVGCSSIFPRNSNHSSMSEMNTQEEMNRTLTDLNIRLQALEVQLNRMSEKLDAFHPKHVSATPLVPTSNDEIGTPIDRKLAQEDPDAGFVHDDNVHLFRKAMILFEGEKYSESVLILNEIVEKHPDHPLAGSAQYYIAESFLKQKDFKQALKEFQKVLTHYDRSAHVPDTLRDIAIVEDNLKMTEDASQHRAQLNSLFPNSPAALQVLSESKQSIGTHSTPSIDSVPPPSPPSVNDPINKQPSSSLPGSSLPESSQNMDNTRFDPPPLTAPIQKENGKGLKPDESLLETALQ